DTQILGEIYSYTITDPAMHGTAYANFDPATGNLLLRGGQVGQSIYSSGEPSNDEIVLKRALNNGVDSLAVTTIITNIVPGTGFNIFLNGQPAQEFDTFIPFADVNSITIWPGQGDDKIALEFSSGTVIPSGGITISVDPGGGVVLGSDG